MDFHTLQLVLEQWSTLHEDNRLFGILPIGVRWKETRGVNLCINGYQVW